MPKVSAYPLRRRAELLDEFAAIRARGFAVDDQAYMRDLCAIGAPIYEHTGALVEATAEISQQLGFHKDVLFRPRQSAR